MHRRTLIRGGLCLGLLLATATLATAVSPVLWTLETFEDFEAGRPEGAAVTAAGELVLAPALRPLRVPPLEERAEPFLWSQAIDSKGTIYVGGGDGGRIYRIPRGGQGSVYYETGDLGVHALAVDRTDVLYAATSPQGKVYRVTGEAKGEVYYQPEDRYIWALAIGPKGEVYAATGERGIIYRITAKGKAEVFFDSEEFHVVSLALDSRGNLLAGTDGRGLVYRIASDGRATVLHDSRLREIHALGIDSKDVLYAAAVGAEAEAAAPLPQPRPPAREGEPAPAQIQPPLPLPIAEVAASATVTVVAAAAATPSVPSPPPRSEVYRIDPDGTVTTVWASQDEVVHSLAIDAGGRPILGTGDPGRIRLLSGVRQSALLARLPEAQVTSLVAGPDHQMYAATSNIGRVYLIDPATGDTGLYLSPTRDTQTLSRWGRIAWRASVPQGTKVEFSTRSGNSSPPDATWSDWSPPYNNAEGSAVASPPARFLQWRARMNRAGASGSGPTVQAVSVAYVPANLPPEIRRLLISPPGVVRERARPPLEPDPMDLAFTGIRVGPEGRPAAGEIETVSEKKVYVRGMRALEWEAEDPNGDVLVFDLHFRGEEETAWKPLVRGLRDAYYAFDSMQLPDGLYRVRLEASDQPSNPGTQVKTAQSVGDPFIVDNTPPAVQVTARRTGRDVVLEAGATDGVGPVAGAAYSLDAGTWVLLVPTDGVSDARSESYSATLTALRPGEHTVIVRVTDLLGNTGAGKATFTTE